MSLLAHIADRVLNRPLLLSPDKAAVILTVLGGRIGVDAPSPEANRFEGDDFVRDEEGRVKRDAFGYAMRKPFKVSNGVGIVSIVGSLVNRGAYVGAYSGVTSYEGIQYQLKQVMAAPEVHSVVLDISSPGGEALGAFETAALVREVAAKKPVVAFVNGMAASAAYAIASGASRIVLGETALAGSIGVVLLHADFSRHLENEGIKPTLIFAGAHKVDGNPYEPLTDAVKGDLQAEVNALYEAFLRTVATGRGARLTTEMARATEARTLIGDAAVAAGLADAVGTFESVLQDLTRATRRNSSTKGKSMTEPNGAPAAEANAGITQAQLDAAVADATARGRAEAEAAINAERARTAALDGLLAKMGGNPKAAEIVAAAKADGSSAEATALKLIESGATQQAAVLGAMREDDASAAGARPAAAGAGAGKAVASTPEEWKAEWSASAELQAEFPSAENYAAFKRAETSGKVRIFNGRAA